MTLGIQVEASVRRLAFAGVLFLAVGFAPAALAIDNSDCFACHGDKDLTRPNEKGGPPVSLFVDEAQYNESIHGKNLCTSCHTEITSLPHRDGFRHHPVSCSNCHRVETDIYMKSDHGINVHKGVLEAASCKDCHGKTHTLLNSRDPNSPVNRANIPSTCGKCHGDTKEMEKYNLRQKGVVISYDKTIHGRAHARGITTAAVCSDCHGSHDLHRSTNPQSKLYWQRIPATCGKCHENVRATYGRSVHGKAVAAGIHDAATCVDCHGEHTIQEKEATASRVSGAHIPDTCGQCHGSERLAERYQMSSTVVQTYMESFHGLAQQANDLTVANCASCHGFHDILPSTDPLSSVNKANLPQTCGKCHQGIGTRLAKGEIKIHDIRGRGKHMGARIVNVVTIIYIVLIVVSIGGMLGFTALDFGSKLRKHIKAVREANGEERMTKWVRRQHLALMITFITLVYTGFVHRFPDAWWGWPFHALQNGSALRGTVHRIAGWAFVVVFIGHMFALLGTPRGKAYAKELMLRLHDLHDAVQQALFNLGLRKEPPPVRRYNYAEKVEYWALIWGSFVMIITGIVLVFTETALRTLPTVLHEVSQTIHFYEAVLATLAILVWHLYWIAFDPNEYPMNPAWLVGKKAPHKGHDHPPAEGEAKPPEHS